MCCYIFTNILNTLNTVGALEASIINGLEV